MVERYRRSLVIPNYTPDGWFECDVFEVTAAGYFREYEIKLTRSDFKADTKKVKQRYDWERRCHIKGQTKHDQLSTFETKGPTKFWFVVPGEYRDGEIVPLISAAEVPSWAGLLCATPRRGHHPPWNVRISQIKAAPKLHGVGIDTKIIEHARGVTYYRFYNQFLYGRQMDQDATPPADEIAEASTSPETPLKSETDGSLYSACPIPAE